MNLLRIGAHSFSVLVTEQVVRELSDWGSAKEPKIAMLSLLTQTVPVYGAQEGNSNICVVFKGTSGLAEFRKGENRGSKIRVLWFYGDTAKTVIVCARAFVKNFPKTPPAEIAATEDARREYFDAIKQGTLSVEDGAHLIRRKSR